MPHILLVAAAGVLISTMITSFLMLLSTSRHPFQEPKRIRRGNISALLFVLSSLGVIILILVWDSHFA